jgi:hypothetical protein
MCGVFLASTAAFAATTPKSGCWGTCGGDFGPKPVAIMVEDKRLSGFYAAEACLGTQMAEGAAGEHVTEDKEIAWSTAGIKVGESAKPGIPIVDGEVTLKRSLKIVGGEQPVPVSVSLTFVSSKAVKGVLTVHYGSCRPLSFLAHGQSF